MVWYGDVIFLGDNSFSHYKMGTHDFGKLRFSRVYGLYRMGTYDVVRGCHPAGEHHYKMLLLYKMGVHSSPKNERKNVYKKMLLSGTYPPIL
jgi:hypothetical protein